MSNATTPAPQDNTLITLSTGVILRGKAVNPITLIRVMASHPRPRPPIVFIKEMGRDMENPDDPNYQEALRSWRMKTNDLTLNALILLGTELVKVPAKFPKPDDEAWINKYRLLGLPVEPGNSDWRYLTWVTFQAAITAEDLRKIQEVVGRMSGVPETSVAAAAEFPGSSDKIE